MAQPIALAAGKGESLTVGGIDIERRHHFIWRRGQGIEQSPNADRWESSFRGLGHDLEVGQYGTAVDWVRWDITAAEPDGIATVLVTVPWRGNDTGHGASIGPPTSTVADITRHAGQATQDALGDINVAWPHRASGGLLYLTVYAHEAMWVNCDGPVSCVGALTHDHVI